MDANVARDNTRREGRSACPMAAHGVEMSREKEGGAAAAGQEERALAALYRLFAEALGRPSALSIRQLRDGVFVEAVEAAFGAVENDGVRKSLASLRTLQRTMQKGTIEEHRKMFEADFNRLFVGPARLLAPPYESVYRNARYGGMDKEAHASQGKTDPAHAIGGRFALELKERYRQAGFVLAPSFHDSADALWAEVEFLGHVHAAEADALEEGDHILADGHCACAQLFVEDHLGRWVDAIADDVQRFARGLFYPALLELLRYTVRAELPPGPLEG